ncbi:MAG: sulfite exporter TauE/SafE family protein [Burkholderiales bacterium]|nr:sulfite exporter TauE/SafE family protein [Burkholderiales bacterium]
MPSGAQLAALHGLHIGGLGAVVGAVLGLTGAGGGAIAVPLLVLGAGLTVSQAGPMSLVAVAMAAWLATALGLHEGVVRYRAALVIGGAGMLLAPAGVWLAQRLPPTPLMLAFAAFLMLTARRMLRPASAARPVDAAPCLRAPGARRLTWTPRCAAVLAGIGSMAGLLSGLLGVGGGFVIVPALERRSNLDVAAIQATSLMVIALVAASGLAAAAWQGGLDVGTAAPFAAGAVAGMLGGRMLGRRLPAAALRRAFGVTTLAMAALLIVRAAGWLG